MKTRVLAAVAALACSVLGQVGCGDSGTGSPTDAAPGADAGPGADASPGADAGAGFNCANPHPAWLLCEDFEASGGDFDAWFANTDFNSANGADDRGRMDLVSDHIHGGNFALHFPAAASSGYEGAALSWRKCLGDVQESPCATMDSFDQLYLRVWVRLAEDHQQVHHFLNIAGSQPDRFWSLGASGCLPNGELSMGTTVDLVRDTHETFFYSYSPSMGCSDNCVSYMGQQWVEDNCQHCADIGLPTCDSGLQCCWGDEFAPNPPVAFPVGQWTCFEMMMQANDPNVDNGVMAYWIDGQLAHQVDNMMWRTIPALALNRVSLQHYLPSSEADSHSNRIWFDDVVVSTQPIGCN